jgi:hypothetical protein
VGMIATMKISLVLGAVGGPRLGWWKSSKLLTQLNSLWFFSSLVEDTSDPL